MATKNLVYDHPAYLVRQGATVSLPATAASTAVNKFVAFTNLKIKAAMIAVNIAGTATAAAYDLFNGTTSVAQMVMGTSAAGSVVSLTQDITLTSGSFLDVKTAAASATLAGVATLEYELIPGAAVTV